jgi:hypothetical protein
MDSPIITIVSGLPRSGTSMMMKMLEAGGMPILTDRIRTADEDNPKGYYEFEQVKKIASDQAWLADAEGKVVKMISALLKHLPPTYTYKIIFMRRTMEEVLASQRQMLIRRGEPADAISDEQMAAMFEKHLGWIEGWLAMQPNMDVLYVPYDEVMADSTTQAQQINEFLDGTLDVAKMVGVVDPSLYRQRWG